MYIQGDVKTGWYLLREIFGTDTPISNIMLPERPEKTAAVEAGEASILKIGFYSNAADNTTATIKLWAFRKESNLAEHIGTIVATVGSNAFTINPVGKLFNGRFVDTVVVTDKWSTDASPLFIATNETADNKCAFVYLDLMGASHIYAECTAGNAGSTIGIFYTYLNS